MEQMRSDFSLNYDSLGGLVTPVILYGRVIFHIVLKPYLGQSLVFHLYRASINTR